MKQLVNFILTLTFSAILNIELSAQCDKNSLQNFFVKKLNETSFTPEAEKYAREAAGRFLALATLDNFEEVYRTDFNGYSINTSALPRNMQAMEWGGSNSAISVNAFGQFTAKPEKSTKGESNAIERKFNTLMASWLKEYMASWEYQSLVEERARKSNPSNLPKSKMKTIEDYIIENKFKSNINACKEYFATMPNELDRKIQIMEWAIDNFDIYKKSMIENAGNWNFAPVPENEMKIREAVRKKDWNSFIRECALNGWAPQAFFQKNGILTGR